MLAGGQYDKLLRRMGRRSGAVGFALYLDLLEDLQKQENLYDIDTLILYNEETAPAAIAKAVQILTEEGTYVSAQKSIPEKLRYRRLMDLRKENGHD